jgi:hypothetical protein
MIHGVAEIETVLDHTGKATELVRAAWKVGEIEIPEAHW